jgi:hypothetical protein
MTKDRFRRPMRQSSSLLLEILAAQGVGNLKASKIAKAKITNKNVKRFEQNSM